MQHETGEASPWSPLYSFPMHARTSLLLAALAASLLGCRADQQPAPITDPTPAPPLTPEIAALQLPTLRITTDFGASIVSTETYVPGRWAIVTTTGDSSARGALEIRGRGNSTWTMPKKPYRLKLGATAPMLGMPSSRHWVLLANYSDKTLLRNQLAFDLSRKLVFAWTPRAQFVSVRLNGVYQGVYQLVEHIRIADERVNIASLKASDTSATNVSGGYLIEVDERSGEAFCPRSTMTPMIFCVKEPETLLEPGWEKQRAYISRYIAQTDSAIFGAQFRDAQTGYASMIDVPSAVDYYLLQELFKNVDGNLRLSTYLYKPRGGKLTFGPVWDFDIAMGNVNYLGAEQTSGWYIRGAPWFKRLFEDPAFAAQVTARRRTLRQNGTVDALLSSVFERGDQLRLEQIENFYRWPILNTWVWPNRAVFGSYDGELIALKDWLRARVMWMDAQLP